MVYQVIGMLSVFACRNDSIRDIILVGTLAKVEQGKMVFERIGNLFQLNFLFPEEAPYAVAIGAVVADLKNNQVRVSVAEI
jgi:type II pantothenate kinase